MPLTKKIFRTNCLSAMKRIAPAQRYLNNHLINERLQRHLQSRRFRSILFYMPLGYEADIKMTLLKLRKSSKVYIPFMVGESFKMVPFRLPLKQKRFGIYEAGDTKRNINKVDIAVVPVVGVDGNMQRVGHGKGMYDRFFSKLKKRPYTIFVQPCLCYTKEFVGDAYDIACDILITPRRELRNKR
ncbi:MAG: 5-formyltetrahydrofolate cyclo-ligase [Epsilonproteobacteria bacterium]|nr:5-formyltetrahydrofolate cyclo-ligase [Campylobacterota bacterium]